MDKSTEIKPVYIENGRVMMIDQNRLPMELIVKEITDWRMMVKAIKEMMIRGAPAIGIAGAMGFYLAARELTNNNRHELTSGMDKAFKELGSSRPTAVNLSWALNRVHALYLKILEEGDIDKMNGASEPKIVKLLREEAERIADEDFQTCFSIGNNGASLIEDGDGVLTHCNAGALATGGWGTAVGVIRSAYRQGKRMHVYVDETRPRLQGARLTAWELEREGIHFTLITDNMAGYFMKKGEIRKVIVGADRIASNGDFANKIGTYPLAVLAREHGIDFYVAAPFSSFDLNISNGDEINVENRMKEEVTEIYPRCDFFSLVKVSNPAFDITPAKYVSAIITEGGIITPPLAAGIIKMVGNHHGVSPVKRLTERG